jgi:hypothetical protein
MSVAFPLSLSLTNQNLRAQQLASREAEDGESKGRIMCDYKLLFLIQFHIKCKMESKVCGCWSYRDCPVEKLKTVRVEDESASLSICCLTLMA